MDSTRHYRQRGNREETPERLHHCTVTVPDIEVPCTLQW
jgi:hypothetical protein